MTAAKRRDEEWNLVALRPVGGDEIRWPNLRPVVLVASGLILFALGCGGQSDRPVELAPDAGVAPTVLDATTHGSSARPDADKSPVDATANEIADAGVDSIGDAGLLGEGPPEAVALDGNDASPDGVGALPPAACGPLTCPGCCDDGGTCHDVPTLTSTACLTDVPGSACRSCPVNAACSFPKGCVCQCPNGCCDSLGECHPGSSNTQCGLNMCEDCTSTGGQCNNQQCTQAVDAGVCNATTCPTGCCDALGECQLGQTGLVCGTTGVNCQNCLASDQICSNQQCISSADAGPGCNQMNCQSGCCNALGVCVLDTSDTQCGWQGSSCVDCTKSDATCQKGSCILVDGGEPCSALCAGCCDSVGVCELGFADTQCGEQGSSCADCTALNPPSTCDLGIAPRACTSEQTQCPGHYAGCPAALQTPPLPPRQHVCSADDLLGAGAACAGGVTSAACSDFFATESVTNPPCFACLTNLSVESCVAPYVDAACNHDTACLDDCTQEACFGCISEASGSQCSDDVLAGVCSAYAAGNDCYNEALKGAAAICNDANDGAWYQALGAQYCAE